MTKYRKKPVVIEATPWFKKGDHPQVKPYEHPNFGGMILCEQCRNSFNNHGWIETLEGGHLVCPGAQIIEGVKGEFYPCKPDIFEMTYEKETPP